MDTVHLEVGRGTYAVQGQVLQAKADLSLPQLYVYGKVSQGQNFHLGNFDIKIALPWFTVSALKSPQKLH